MKRSLLLACLASLVFTTAPCRADEMADDFAWFDTLGFPRVKGLEFVRYVSGWGDDGPNYKPYWSEGFLLEETPEKYRIQTLDFGTIDVPKHRPEGFAKAFEPFVKPADFKAYAESLLAPDPKESDGRHRIYLPGQWRAPTFELERTPAFVLAWDCSQRGLDDLAARFYARASEKGGGYGGEEGWSLRRKLERDVAYFELQGIDIDMADPAITRPQLLDKLERFQKTFPDTSSTPRAKELADKLRTAIAEDASHPKLTAEQIAKLPPAEQAQEWVFRLRDQRGTQMSNPGGVSVFAVYAKDKNGKETGEDKETPAQHLLALGPAAVPALLAAFDDGHLTRAGGGAFGRMGTQGVIPVGRAAREILDRIAYRDFRDKSAAEAWWKVRREKGEEAELAATVASGDGDAASVVYMFTQKYPDHALATVLAGVKAAKSPYIRSELVSTAERLKKDSVPKSLLLEKAAEGQPLDDRMQATFDLAKMGNLDAIPALAKLWPKMKSVPEEGESDSDEDTREAFIALLASVDSPVGIKTLGKGLGKCDATTRSTVLRAFDIWGMSPAEMYFDASGPMARGKRSPATLAAIEALLASELEDKGPIGFSGGENGIELPGYLRLGDYAAFLLSQRWPDRYKLKTTGSLEERDKQRLACLATWRKSQGLKSAPAKAKK